MSTILVVDDQRQNREFLVTLLRYDGHTVVEAADGDEALSAVRSAHPALVISDLVMPKTDGYQFVRQMRKEPAIAHTPVVFYTANYFEREARGLALACGVGHVLTKPAEPEMLLRVVHDVLGGRAAPVAAAGDPATFDQDHVRLMTDKLSAKVAELEAKRQRLAAVAGIIERVSHQQETVALFERFASDARAVIAVEAVVVLIGDGPDSLRVVATSGSRDSSTGHTLEVPLASPSFRYGVVRFAGRLGQEGFTDEDRAIAASLASALSVAYENILRYEALRNHAAELEHRVAERTAELKRSNEDLEQFAYVASHDLQEPLRMVASYTQLLAKRYHGRLDADADEFIHFAVDGATRMQTLIHDLLAYSRVGARGGVERFAVDEAVDAAIANLVDAIAASGGSIVRDALPTIATDPTKLTQLFQNLIGNALKFSRKGVPPAIRVGARRCDAGWAFSVADNGIGIEPQYAERVFVIFQRLHTRAQYEGTGIGLALCKRIVTGFGGRIWLESTPGEGSTFFFTVPDSQER